MNLRPLRPELRAVALMTAVHAQRRARRRVRTHGGPASLLYFAAVRTFQSLDPGGQGLLESPGRSIYGGIWATASVTGQGHRRRVAVRNEVPECQPGEDSGASGVAVVQINAETDEITYRVVAWDLPATIAGSSTGAHIHVIDPNSPTGLTGPIVVHFERGLNTGLWRRGRLPTRPLPRRFWRTLRTTTATSTPRRARPERSGGNSGNHHKPICQGAAQEPLTASSLLRGLFRGPGPQPTLSSRHYWSSARTRSPVRSSRLSPHGQAPPLVMWTLRNAMG